VLTQGIHVQWDGLCNQLLDLFTAVADSHAAGKVRHVRTPSISFVLDDYDVLSHAVPFRTCRPAAISKPEYPWALVAGLARHRDGSMPVRMTELAMEPRLPVEMPAFPIQDLDHLSHLHDLRLRMPRDSLSDPLCTR
jgi:hypothetical protein